jgi:branched-subunit amino acid aminotransferase/4-amino-4-deoxychorismate lyase
VMEQYLNLNGVYLNSELPLVASANRSFRFGDSLFESIRIANGKPQFMKEHFQRLKLAINTLKYEAPDFYSKEFFENAITQLAVKNGIDQNGRVRITVFRNGGTMYEPENNDCSYLIEAQAIDTNGYELNFKGITVDLFPDLKKQANPISNIKTGNSLIYVLAGVYKQQKQLDDVILLNDNSHIIESTNANIFAVKNGVLYTPPINEGCVDGVMRKKIIELAGANRIAVYEISLLQNVLLSADELFLTNAIFGIKWIVAYKQKRYFNNTAKKMTEKLNEHIGLTI